MHDFKLNVWDDVDNSVDGSIIIEISDLLVEVYLFPLVSDRNHLEVDLIRGFGARNTNFYCRTDNCTVYSHPEDGLDGNVRFMVDFILMVVIVINEVITFFGISTVKEIR